MFQALQCSVASKTQEYSYNAAEHTANLKKNRDQRIIPGINSDELLGLFRVCSVFRLSTNVKM